MPRYRFVDPELYHSLSGLPRTSGSQHGGERFGRHFVRGVCLLRLLGFHHFQREPKLGPTATTYLMMLVASFFGGSFLGVIGGMD